MSRAIRRQQAKDPAQAGAATRGGRTRPPRLGAGGPAAPSRGARPVAQPRRGLRPRMPGFAQDIGAELKKVTWPSWPETRYLTVVVIFVALSVGIMLGVIDIFFNWLIDRLLLQ